MDWKTLLAYISGSVDEELLLRNEYLVAENRILHNQIKGRVQLSDAERQTLAEIGKKLGKRALEEVAHMVKPDTILRWQRKLAADKFDGSKQHKSPGRPRVDKELEELVVRMAKENRSWGYDRIAGALAHLGYDISDQTIGNILVLFFIKLDTREVHIAGVTPHPNERWMKQVARNVTMEEWGILQPGQYLIHDGDTKFCTAFKQTLDDAGIKRVPLPPRSPRLNAFAERWIKSMKEEALSQFISQHGGSVCGTAEAKIKTSYCSCN